MAINKVIFGENTLVDLTADTVSSGHLETGYTAHDKSGVQINGSLVIQEFYTGGTDPSSSLGKNGDLYFKVVD